MKKFLMMAALLVSALVFAEETATSTATASTLYWSVDESSLYYADAFTAVLIGKDGSIVTGVAKNAQTGKFSTDNVYTFSGSSSDLFFLELLNANNEVISVSDSWTYAGLVSGGYMDTFPSDPKLPDTVHSQMIVLNASHVPEPSSGLLLVLGLAGLALKRKRRA